MKERPILFSANMVKAILEDRKTQTRRVIKPQPLHIEWFTHNEYAVANCTYGQPGDRLWVRETWYSGIDKKTLLGYKTDIDIPHGRPYMIRPSIFLPRNLSRITLEITKVRIQRIQEITEGDAKDEGIYKIHLPLIAPNGMDVWTWENYPTPNIRDTAITAYRLLWNSINGKKYPWSSNPWVWVIEFKRI